MSARRFRTSAGRRMVGPAVEVVGGSATGVVFYIKKKSR